MKYPKVCIIILNWNGKNLLETCLSSLFKLTDYPNYKVIVVDNGSTDGSVEFVKKNFPQVDILALDKNYGFPRGNNEGIKYALKKYNPEYVLLLNNDTEIIQKDWLTKMVEVAESDEKIGIVGCKLLYPDGKIQFAGGSYFRSHVGHRELDKGQYDKIYQSEFITGACLLIKKRLIDLIGLLDEVYTPIYCEDVDYCIRAKKAGFKIIYNGFAKLIHNTMQTVKSLNLFFVAKRNEFILLFRYFPLSFLLFKIAKTILSTFFERENKNLKINKYFLNQLILIFASIRNALLHYERYKIH